MLITKGKTNWKYILIVAVLAIIVVGGILWLSMEKEAPPTEKKPERYCEKDTDCACGIHKATGSCFYGNKNYVDTTQQCPDFCSGITGNLIIKCVNNQCVQKSKEVEDKTANWSTYRNDEYGFEIKYPEKEMPLDQGGPTYEPNVFYFGHEPYEYRISLLIFDVSEKEKYPLPSKYTKETEITIDNKKGIKYEREWEAPAGFERGVDYEAHMRREITVDVEHEGKIYRFHLNRATDYQRVFEIFDQMLSSFELLSLEKMCIDSGGEVSVGQFCRGHKDFLDTCFCFAGACTCPSDSSEEIKICDCGPHRCFDGNRCIDLEEKIIGEETTDLKGQGHLQLINLIELTPITTKEAGRGAIIQIFTDKSGERLEWESSFIPLEFGGWLSVTENPATGRPTIEVSWGAGAHGMWSLFFHWTGSQFEEMGEFFSDGGGIWLNKETGKILVGHRHYSCPLSVTVWLIYEWNGNEYELTETVQPECP